MLSLAALALLTAADADLPSPALIFTWTDAEGTFHITDRLDEVPPKLRERYARRIEEAREARKPAKPVPPTETRKQPSAYERLKERDQAEQRLKERALALRQTIASARREQAKLAEERGYLASNPVLNAAQPARVERMQEIDAQTKSLDDKSDEALAKIKQLLLEAKNKGLPEEWVTGLE